jgi:hypothetical protein
VNKKKAAFAVIFSLILFGFLSGQSRKGILLDEGLYDPGIDWVNELGYDKIYGVRLGAAGTPQVEVLINGEPFDLGFDFGDAAELTVTDHIEGQISYTVLDESKTYNADGSFRDTIKIIEIEKVRIFGRDYHKVRASLVNWKAFSSEPFNGFFGLDYLKDRRFTLDYKRKILGVSDEPLPGPFLMNKHLYTLIPIIEQKYHPYGIHVKGKINGTPSLIYLDTGSSHSFADEKILESDDPEQIIDVEMGGMVFRIKDVRIRDIQRNTDHELTVGLKMGSDLLRYFVVTVDRTGGRNELLVLKRWPHPVPKASQ